MPSAGFVGGNASTSLTPNFDNALKIFYNPDKNSSYGTASNVENILSNVLAMDAKNIGVRNELQSNWLDRVMDFNSSEAEKNRDFQSRENEINRRLQIELSNSAYSRAIDDLKNSGINPYFAISKGLSASTPSFASVSGSAASVATPNAISQSDIMSSYTSIFNNLVNNAFNSRKLSTESSVKLAGTFLKFLK